MTMTSMTVTSPSEIFVVDVLSQAARITRDARDARPQAAARVASSAQSLSYLCLSLSLPRLADCARSLSLAYGSSAEEARTVLSRVALDLASHVEQAAPLWTDGQAIDIDADLSHRFMAELSHLAGPDVLSPVAGAELAKIASLAAMARIQEGADPARADDEVGPAPEERAALHLADPLAHPDFAPALEAAQAAAGEAAGPDGPDASVSFDETSALPTWSMLEPTSALDRAKWLHASLPLMDEAARDAAEAEILQVLASLRSSHRLSGAATPVQAAPPVLAALVRAAEAMAPAGPADVSAGEHGIHVVLEPGAGVDVGRAIATAAAQLQPWGGSVDVVGRQVHLRVCADEHRWPVVVLRVPEGRVAIPAPQFRGASPMPRVAGEGRPPSAWVASLRIGATEHAFRCLGPGPTGPIVQPAWRYALPADWPAPTAWTGAVVTADGQALPLWSPAST